jgi:cytochrome d ubiquinol oxidase subunit I
LFALPDPAAETNRYEIAIPGIGSLILTHDLNGEVRGLKEWAPQDRPPVRIVFWSFRIMVGIGVAMLLIAFTGLYLGFRGRLYDSRWFLQICRLASPLGFIAILAGWITAEVGRQPYVVYGLMRTIDGVSPVAGGAVGLSLLLFGTAYLLVFAAGAFYIQQLLRKGPGDLDSVKNAPSGMRAARPLSVAGDLMGPDK